MIGTGDSQALHSVEEEFEGDDDFQLEPDQAIQLTEVRFLLQSKSAGAIIGKGGSNITRLRQEYRANVLVPDCPGPERILSILVETYDLRDIMADVIPKLEGYANPETPDTTYEVRMLLHQDHAGCIIGKGGSQIKLLREKSDAQIKVYTNCCPFSTERVVQIYGDLNSVLDCIVDIVDLIADAPIRITTVFYDPKNYDSLNASFYGGYSDGSRGAGVMYDQWSGRNAGAPQYSPYSNSMRNRTNPQRTRQYGYGLPEVNSWNQNDRRYMEPIGPPFWNNTALEDQQLPPTNSRFRRPREGGMYPFSTRFPFSQPPTESFNNDNMGNYPNQNSTMGDYAYRQPVQDYRVDCSSICSLFERTPVLNEDMQTGTATITIPNEFAGAIIGKGGQRIRKIRRDSGATITIEECQPGNPCRAITITGALPQITLAQILLKENVCEYYGK